MPVAQLLARMPANGYGFVINYRIGLTNANGAPPNAGAFTVLSASRFTTMSVLPPAQDEQDDDGESASIVMSADDSAKPVFQVPMRRLLQQAQTISGSTYEGSLYFTVFVVNGTITDIKVTNVFDQFHATESRGQSVLMTQVILLPAVLFLYLVGYISSYAWSKSKNC